MHPRLFTNLVTDALAEQTYDADLAGMSYSLSDQYAGLVIAAGGYSDKLSVLLHSILNEMKSFVINPDRFAVIKEQVRMF